MRNQEMEYFLTVSSEAYFLFTNRPPQELKPLLEWYNDPELWIKMAKKLEETPFLLLAEDSYWEAFLRAPLTNKAIELQMSHMRKYSRTESAYCALLERAYKNVTHWNTYVRHMLVALDSADGVLEDDPRHWKAVFKLQEFLLAKIQTRCRFFLVKLHWAEMKAFYEKKKEYHQAMMKLSITRGKRANEQWIYSLVKFLEEAVN